MPIATICFGGEVPGGRNGKHSDLCKDQCGLEKIRAETVRDLVADCYWSLPGVMTDRKGACMAHPTWG